MTRPKYLSIIRWVDQHYQIGPLKAEEMLEKCIGETTGFLIAEDDDQIALAAEWFEWRDDYRHIIHIPKCAILSHKKIKINGRRRSVWPRGA